MMIKAIKYLFLTVLTVLVLQGCDTSGDDIIPEPKGKTSLTISGAISASIKHDVVEFTHTAIQAQKSSGLQLGIGNFGTTETVVSINLLDSDNGKLFTTGTYTFSGDQNETLFLTAVYGDKDNGYSIDSEAVNKIELTEVNSTSIKGEVDLNLIDMSSTGDKINIKGTFEAVGSTFQL